MGTGKGAKAEENITTEESGKNPQVESGSVEEEEPCEEPEELEENPNWEEEVTEDELAQYEFEPEEFETEQDYYDYLERQKRLGILDEEQKVKLQSRTQIQTKSEKVEAVDKPIKAMDTLTLNKSDIKFTIVNAGKYATQAQFERMRISNASYGI